MTDTANRDLAVEALKRTTIPYPEWFSRVQNGWRGRPYDATKTEWGKAFLALDKIGETVELAVSPQTQESFDSLLVELAQVGEVGVSWEREGADILVRLTPT